MATHVRVLAGALLPLVFGSALAAAAEPQVADAVRSRDAGRLRALLQQRADVNLPQADGATALHWAAHRDDLATTELLIRAGARVGAANQLGATPLYLACLNRSVAIAEQLLTAGADANAALPSGETALMTAARTGSGDLVKTLVAHGADVNRREPAHGETALMWAVAARHPDVVRTLVEVGANVQARTETRHRRIQVGQRFSDHDARTTAYADLGGFTPLLFAVRQGDIESLKILLAAGGNVNDAAASGTSALVVAAHSDQRAAAVALLDAGADANTDGAGYTALHAAVLRGDRELVNALLAHGANPNAAITTGTPVRYASQDYALNAAHTGATPYWLAARFAEIEIMRALATAGADPRRVTKDGMTAVMAALAGSGGNNTVGTTSDRRERVLTPTELAERSGADVERETLNAFRAAIELGADIRAASQTGETALHTAASRGYTEAVQELLERGADVQAANLAGDTPLHQAATRGFVAVIELLAEKGAQLEARNKKGQTPLALTTIQVGVGGASFIPESNRRSAAETLRRLGATQ